MVLMHVRGSGKTPRGGPGYGVRHRSASWCTVAADGIKAVGRTVLVIRVVLRRRALQLAGLDIPHLIDDIEGRRHSYW